MSFNDFNLTVCKCPTSTVYRRRISHSYPWRCGDFQLIYESLNSPGIWWALVVEQIQNDLVQEKTEIIVMTKIIQKTNFGSTNSTMRTRSATISTVKLWWKIPFLFLMWVCNKEHVEFISIVWLEHPLWCSISLRNECHFRSLERTQHQLCGTKWNCLIAGGFLRFIYLTLKWSSTLWHRHIHNRWKQTLTLALNPKTSWAVCLKLMSSGTVWVTMVTNSSTFPYCFTFLCRMTCHI